MKHCIVILACTATVVITARAEAAFTNMNGSFSGSMCKKVGTQGTAVIAPLTGAMTNSSSTQALTVDCPIAAGGDGAMSVRVIYGDDSPSALTCSLLLEDASTDLVNGTSDTSSVDDGLAHVMELDATQFKHGQAHLRCTIPPLDGVFRPSGIKGYHAGSFTAEGRVHHGYNTFPGSNCRKVSGNGTPFIAGDGSLGNAASQSTPGGTLVVDCPSITIDDETGSPRDPSVVWYVDNSPADFSCTMRAEAELGSLLTDRTLASNFDDGTYRAFSFTGSTAIRVQPGSVVHTRCNVPTKDSTGRASYVVGYSLAMTNERVNDGGLLRGPDKRFPATQCAPTNDVTMYDAEGAAFNTALNAAVATIDCPVLTPQGSDLGPSSKTFKVTYVDNSAQGNVSCTYSAEDDLSTVHSQVTLQSGRNDAVHSQLSFTGLAHFQFGPHRVFCSIPGRDTAAETPSKVLAYEG